MLLLEKKIMKIGLVSLLILSSVPVNAHESRRGYTTQRSCYKETYREEYVARTRSSQGYMKSFTDRVVVPCSSISKVHHHRYHLQNQRSIPSYNYSRTHYYQPNNTYTVSRSKPTSSACRSSRATSGVLGGGLGAAVIKKDAWGWSIPIGAIIGLSVSDVDC